MLTGQLQAYQNKAKSHIIKKLTLIEYLVFTGKSQTSALQY